jgi:hypothetical protein
MTLLGRIGALGGVLVLTLTMACTQGSPPPQTREREAVSDTTIEEALSALTDRVIDQNGVTGTGIGSCNGNPCLKVYVVRRDAPVISNVPSTLGGWDVSVEVSGEIRGGGTDT